MIRRLLQSRLLVPSQRRRRQDRLLAALHRSDRKGAALALAMFAIAVIGVLVVGSFFTSVQDFRGARNSLVEQRAFAVAEFGLNTRIANWDRGLNLPSGLAIGAIDSGSVYVAAGDTSWVKITRLTDQRFWVVSSGRANMGTPAMEALRKTSAVVRLAYPSIAPSGAIMTMGNLDVSGSAFISGKDTMPAGWTQCANMTLKNTAAISANPTAAVSYKAQNIDPQAPAVVHTAAAGDSNSYVRYGTESWNSLKSNADITLPGSNFGTDIAPSVVNGACNTSDAANWGEPLRAGAGFTSKCINYFPIIYVDGDLQLSGKGRGQGILLVNGDFKISGQFQWYGLIIVRDDITKGNGTSDIWGTVLARDAVIVDNSVVNGNTNYRWSSCAVESALRGSAILVRQNERGWAQLF